MKKILLAAFLILMMPAMAAADYDSTLTVSSTAVRLNNSAWGFHKCLCRVETNDIRWWADGTAPTASTGILLKVGETLTLDDPDETTNFKCIRVTSDATLSCHCK